jgi:hypothetical protein
LYYRLIVLCLSIAAIAATLAVSANGADYLLNATFSDGKLPSSFDASGNDTARVSGGAVKIDLDRYKDEVPERTELVPKKLPVNAFDDGKLAHIGEEYWYGIRILVPKTWKADNSYEVVTQWHGVNQGPAIALRMDSPGVSAGLHSQNEIADRWLLMIDKKAYDLAPVRSSVDQWTDWVFRIRWSPSADGHITLWCGKQRVADVAGPTMAPDTLGLYWKFGIYKSPWKQVPSLVPIQSHRTLFFDNVRIGQGGAIDIDNF